jgi:hypothetical protein
MALDYTRFQYLQTLTDAQLSPGIGLMDSRVRGNDRGGCFRKADHLEQESNYYHED